MSIINVVHLQITKCKQIKNNYNIIIVQLCEIVFDLDK
jgi:hypothetical protein